MTSHLERPLYAPWVRDVGDVGPRQHPAPSFEHKPRPRPRWPGVPHMTQGPHPSDGKNPREPESPSCEPAASETSGPGGGPPSARNALSVPPPHTAVRGGGMRSHLWSSQPGAWHTGAAQVSQHQTGASSGLQGRCRGRRKVSSPRGWGFELLPCFTRAASLRRASVSPGVPYGPRSAPHPRPTPPGAAIKIEGAQSSSRQTAGAQPTLWSRFPDIQAPLEGVPPPRQSPHPLCGLPAPVGGS